MEFQDFALQVLRHGARTRRNFHLGCLANPEGDTKPIETNFVLACIDFFVYIHGEIFELELIFDLKDVCDRLNLTIEEHVPKGSGSLGEDIDSYLSSPDSNSEKVKVICHLYGLLGVCGYYYHLENDSQDDIETAVEILGNPKVFPSNVFNYGYHCCAQLRLGLYQILNFENTMPRNKVAAALSSIESGQINLRQAIKEYPLLSSRYFQLFYGKKEKIIMHTMLSLIAQTVMAGILSFFCGEVGMTIAACSWFLLQTIYAFEKHALMPTLGVFVKTYYRYQALSFAASILPVIQKRSLFDSKKELFYLKLISKLRFFLSGRSLLPLLFIFHVCYLGTYTANIFMGAFLLYRLYHSVYQLSLFSRHGLPLLSIYGDRLRCYFQTYFTHLSRQLLEIKELKYCIETVGCDQDHGRMKVGSLRNDPNYFILGDPVARDPGHSHQHDCNRAAVLVSSESSVAAFYRVKAFICRLEHELPDGRFQSIWEPMSLPDGFESLGSISYVSSTRLGAEVFEISNPALPVDLKAKFTRMVCLHRDLLTQLGAHRREDKIPVSRAFNASFMRSAYCSERRSFLAGSGSFFLMAPDRFTRAQVRLRPSTGHDDGVSVIRSAKWFKFFSQIGIALIVSAFSTPFGLKAAFAVFVGAFILSRVNLFSIGSQIKAVSSLAAQHMPTLFQQFQQRIEANEVAPPAIF